MTKKEKTGVIDVGGGLRGIYGTGVFDYCIDKGIRFDYGIGVSAGSANLMSYAAGQIGRNYAFYTEFSNREESMGLRDMVRNGNFVNLEYIYGTLSAQDGEYPLDYAAFEKNPMELFVVATDVETGEAVYFTRKDIHLDDYRVIMASSTVPGFCEPFEFDGRLYYDGGVSDPIPVSKAFADGCGKVVLILTKPVSQRRRISKRERALAAVLRKKYPRAAKKLRSRMQRYYDSLDTALHLQKAGKVLIVAPDDIGDLQTLTKDMDELKRLYRKGLADARAIPDFLRG